MLTWPNHGLPNQLDKCKLKICARCIYDERVANIKFDGNGVCNYCHQVDNLMSQYGTGKEEGRKKLSALIAQIKKSGRRKKYDCVIGVSGGTDSSYLLHLAKGWGLRPLAVHYDNTWNSGIATQNIKKMLDALDIDLYTYVVDNKEADDIFRAFFDSGVPELEASTDLALAEVLYRAASAHGIKFILEGHSFMSEGITPLNFNYFDGKYIRSIHKKFGKKKMSSYPLMTLARFLWWSIVARIRKVRPYWYIHHTKAEARQLLESQYNWTYYGGHHLENQMTSFFHQVYLPLKFNTIMTNNALSAQARHGEIEREEAWTQFVTEPNATERLTQYVGKRLNISADEMKKHLMRPGKNWTQFPTYKKTFERLRPVFSVLAKTNLVPMSFYLKYCFPINVED